MLATGKAESQRLRERTGANVGRATKQGWGMARALSGSTKGGQTSLPAKPDGLGSHPHSPQEEAPDSPRKHQDGAKSPALGDVEGQ